MLASEVLHSRKLGDKSFMYRPNVGASKWASFSSLTFPDETNGSRLARRRSTRRCQLATNEVLEIRLGFWYMHSVDNHPRTVLVVCFHSCLGSKCSQQCTVSAVRAVHKTFTRGRSTAGFHSLHHVIFHLDSIESIHHAEGEIERVLNVHQLFGTGHCLVCITLLSAMLAVGLEANIVCVSKGSQIEFNQVPQGWIFQNGVHLLVHPILAIDAHRFDIAMDHNLGSSTAGRSQ
mmetsp:Transcript_85154/g.150652  ORF Transcript_85154/g.150652 Transcript_85154/m.150652 type:complete len:233 (+) Transcript_85154:149-847(+)